MQKVNVIAERHKFHQQAQRHNETIAQYVSALHEMLQLCEFRHAEQDMLHDQTVEKPAVNVCINLCCRRIN